MSEGEGEDWIYADEDHEYAYADYANSNKRKRADPGSSSTAATVAANSAAAAADAGLERAAPWIPDAFRGHHCPICLESIEDSAMIELCRHLFCRSCLFEWLAVADRCPLCKVKVTRVLHDIKTPKEYKVRQHVKGTGARKTEGGSSIPASRGTLTETADCGGSGARRAEFRSLVYKRGLAADLPEPKARCPKSANELRPWIAREVQAVAGNPGGGRGGATETRLVADVVEALLKDNDVDDQEGYCRVKEQGFMFENTDPFLHELWCFRWSKAGMSAYDRDTMYSSRPHGRH